MNWLDTFIIVVVVIASFWGLKTGIIKAVLSLAGSVVGIILAGHYHVVLAEQLSFISQAGIAKVVAFAIIIIVVMIIATVLASLLKWVVSIMMLGWINRIGGAVFGLALGAIFCSVLLAIWVKFMGVEAAITESALAALLLDRFPMVLALLPGEFDVVHSFFQ
ncbi:CvpA family protein [Chloroflexota bacterium]